MTADMPHADEPKGLPFSRLWSVDTGRFILFGDLRKSGMARVELHLVAFIFAILASVTVSQIAMWTDRAVVRGNPTSPATASMIEMASWWTGAFLLVVLAVTMVAAVRAFIEEERAYRQEDKAEDQQP